MGGDPEDALVMGRFPVVDLNAAVVGLDDPSLGMFQPHRAAIQDQNLVVRRGSPTVAGSEREPPGFRMAHVEQVIRSSCRRGKTPFELLVTAEGAQVVEEELTAIDEGYVA